MNASKKANLQFVIALGVTMGAAQVVYRGVSESLGIPIAMLTVVLVSALLAYSVSWLTGRLIKTRDR